MQEAQILWWTDGPVPNLKAAFSTKTIQQRPDGAKVREVWQQQPIATAGYPGYRNLTQPEQRHNRYATNPPRFSTFHNPWGRLIVGLWIGLVNWLLF
jgi:hypothetical protein